MIRRLAVAAALCTSLASVPAASAWAATQALPTDGSWSAFDVDVLFASTDAWIDLGGDLLAFSFTTTGPVRLDVVDGGFSGDVFELFDHGESIGYTGVAGGSYPDSLGLDFDAAWATPSYSQGSFLLEAGTHLITGRLAVSARDDLGQTLDATVGALRVSAVPEPEDWVMLLAGLGIMGFVHVRRQRRA